MLTKLNKVKEGFTIVEVLIVLAIAALILAIILIALPDLQRSSRNSNIFHDAQNLASANQTYEGNNQGQVAVFLSGSGTKTITIGTTPAATSTAEVQPSDIVNFADSSAAVVSKTNVPPGTILVDFKADCQSGNPGSAAGTSLTPGADNRAVAVFYPIEVSGSSNVGCVQE